MISSSPPKPIINLPKLSPFGRKLLNEFYGTFVLLWLVCMVNDTSNAKQQGGIAVGLGVTSVVFTTGYQSLAQINPAVSFASYLLGIITPKEFVGYVIAQLVAGFSAALLVMALVTHEGEQAFPVVEPPNDSARSIFALCVAESLATMILAMPYAQSFAYKGKQNNFAALGIGAFVMAQAYAAGKISGASFNPAVTTSLQLTKCILGKCEPLKYYLWFILAELFGGFLCFVWFCVTGSYAKGEGNNYEDDEEEEIKRKEQEAEVPPTTSVITEQNADRDCLNGNDSQQEAASSNQSMKTLQSFSK